LKPGGLEEEEEEGQEGRRRRSSSYGSTGCNVYSPTAAAGSSRNTRWCTHVSLSRMANKA
jgi:hypothetical protein